MYLVVSTWEPVQGKGAEAQSLGKEMRSRMRAVPGVEFLEHFEASDNEVVVVVAYRDEPTYHRIVDDPDGVFQKGFAQLGLESVMTWKKSWRGEAVPH